MTHPAHEPVLTPKCTALIAYKARQVARKPGFCRADEEDLAQYLTLQLLAKAPQYDPTRASFLTFADRVLASAIGMLLRYRRRKKRAAGLHALSLETLVPGADGDLVVLHETLAQGDDRRRW